MHILADMKNLMTNKIDTIFFIFFYFDSSILHQLLNLQIKLDHDVKYIKLNSVSQIHPYKKPETEEIFD